MNRLALSIPLLIFFGQAVSGSDETVLPPLGMWSWRQSAFLTEESRKEMLDFCEREEIHHIDQHVSLKKSEAGEYAMQNAQSFSDLIAEAAKRKITVNALRGDKEMFFAKNHQRTKSQLRALLHFNKGLPEGARLAGIKFDVEPYLTPEWKAGGESRKKVILDYLSALKMARAEIHAQEQPLNLCADVPFWWDKPEFESSFGGEQKRFVHHVQDLTDWIGIMSYRRESRLVLRFVEDEIAYADKNGLAKSVAPALDTIEIKGEESFITFWGTPPETFRKTLQEVRQHLSGSASVRMIMLHDYRSLKEYLEQEE